MPKFPQERVRQVGLTAEAALGRDHDHPLLGVEDAGKSLTQAEAFQIAVDGQASVALENATEVEGRHAHPRRQAFKAVWEVWVCGQNPPNLLDGLLMELRLSSGGATAADGAAGFDVGFDDLGDDLQDGFLYSQSVVIAPVSEDRIQRVNA